MTAPVAPADLKQARIFMWIQVALSAIGPLLLAGMAGISLLDLISLTQVYIVITYATAIALAVCAVVLPKRQQWAFVTAAVIEGLLVLNSLVTLLSKGLPGLLPLIFAGLALRALLTRDVRTWFFPQQPSVS
ncbi:hypothetical protein [Amycolatopsis circi]|uniref:hypothetical protein n=1 Tax=Amycolatopsis circi TaxID=871959 RepID=UPI000E25E036|nr:hypothetical protein [Amycolatopsis circi]